MKFLPVRLLCLATTLALFGAPTVRAQEAPQPATVAPAAPLFDDKERAALVAYWNAPGRYTLSAPEESVKTGPWQVRLTPEGSTWLLNYSRAIAGSAKVPPTRDARPVSGLYSAWETWITARVAYDRAVAQQAADTANKAVLLSLVAPISPSGQGTSSVANPGTLAPSLSPLTGATPLPPAPGPAPADLVARCGNPPPFANIVAPVQYQVTFDKPDEIFVYQDNVKMRERYAYYRFPRGVVSYGTRLKDMSPQERDNLFRAAGFSPSEQKIFTQVSGLEGGFETVQTYDTGYVSIGFIQFVTLADGRADLSQVLLSEKANRADEFRADFRRFGIDVRPDGTMVVIDPSTGVELSGNDAVLKVIDDKRLTAVFQRAGRHSGFRVAQIKTAKSYYWPSSDAVTVTLADGSTASGSVGDLVKSEAGMATLLDRKINTGNIRVLSDVVARVMNAHGAKSFKDVAPFEREIVAAMKYRADFLADASLGQPVLPVVPPTTPILPAAAPTIGVKPAVTTALTKPTPTTVPVTPGSPTAPIVPITPAGPGTPPPTPIPAPTTTGTPTPGTSGTPTPAPNAPKS